MFLCFLCARGALARGMPTVLSPMLQRIQGREHRLKNGIGSRLRHPHISHHLTPFLNPCTSLATAFATTEECAILCCRFALKRINTLNFSQFLKHAGIESFAQLEKRRQCARSREPRSPPRSLSPAQPLRRSSYALVVLCPVFRSAFSIFFSRSSCRV